uniref:Uncharacterized protein n=1 Tax=Rhizophora mucronata TaxID=61149 RepID=A0A2P2QAP8_RHIMU
MRINREDGVETLVTDVLTWGPVET